MDGDDWSNGETLTQCEQPWGYKSAAEVAGTTGDCDDSRNYCYPGAPELCNNLDDDCDGQVDESLADLTYVGNVTFSNQAQVNAWSQCYTVIQGNLLIQNATIDSLSKLVNLRKVTGNVTIKLTGLDSLDWLLELDTIGGHLTINNNPQLATLDGLDNLMKVGGNLATYFNYDLTDCCAIHDLVNETNGRWVGGSVSIHHNDSGCDNVGQINEECGGGQNLVAPPACPDCPAVLRGFSLQEKQSIGVFPNPATDAVHVRIQQPFASGSLRLFDSEGRVVLQQKLEKGTLEYRLELSNLASGIYCVQALVDGESFVEKLQV
jgi:hypothetical protein